MKQEVEKKNKTSFESKVPDVTIDPELNKLKGKVLFPKKLALAEEHLKGLDLTIIEKHKRRSGTTGTTFKS